MVALSDNLPHDLTSGEQFVGARFEPQNGRVAKVPISPHTGSSASVSDPQTWGTYGEAKALDLDAVGRVLVLRDGIVGIDLDHCRDALTGDIEPWAQEIVLALDSYTEVSPSGTGLHVWVRGTLPRDGGKRGRVEMYRARHYFTLTGDRLAGAPTTLNDRQDALDTVYSRTFDPPQTTGGDPVTTANTVMKTGRAAHLDNDALVERAKSAKNGAKFSALWNGDASGYKSASEADQALCNILAYWAGSDADRIDWQFRQSGLMRDKWDSARADSTYGADTIRKAIEWAPVDAYTLTDVGNGQRLVKHHGEDLLYCVPQRRWYIWDGQHWQHDNSKEIERRAKLTAKNIYVEAASADNNETMAKHAIRSQSSARVKAMIDMASSEREVVITPDHFDQNRYLFNCQNGTVNLRTGQLQQHNRADLITKLTPVAYDPYAHCPRFVAFLNEVFSGDTDTISFVQRAVGSALTGDVRDHALFFLYGEGRNGKSTLLNILLYIMGDYAKEAAPSLLLSKHFDAHPTEIADLFGARFVATVEVEDGRQLAESLVKHLTGGDKIKARRMREDFWEFEPTHHIFLAANHKPEIRGTDTGIWSRIQLVPFNVSFYGREDRTLGDVLRAESSGILAWAIQGCLQWQKEGLNRPQAIEKATGGYRADSDTVQRWIDECCTKGPNMSASAADIHGNYKKWCSDAGEHAVTKKQLGERLEALGFTQDRTASTRLWRGLCVPESAAGGLFT